MKNIECLKVFLSGDKIDESFGGDGTFFFEKSSESDKRDQVLELYFKVREFLNIHDILDENYVIYSEYQQDGRFMVKLFV